jgi:hypothetical protein
MDATTKLRVAYIGAGMTAVTAIFALIAAGMIIARASEYL